MRKQRRILVVLRVPVDTIHGGLEKVIALLPPDFVEDLFPFGGRVDLHAHGFKLQCAVSGVSQRLGLVLFLRFWPFFRHFYLDNAEIVLGHPRFPASSFGVPYKIFLPSKERAYSSAPSRKM